MGKIGEEKSSSDTPASSAAVILPAGRLESKVSGECRNVLRSFFPHAKFPLAENASLDDCIKFILLDWEEGYSGLSHWGKIAELNEHYPNIVKAYVNSSALDDFFFHETKGWGNKHDVARGKNWETDYPLYYNKYLKCLGIDTPEEFPEKLAGFAKIPFRSHCIYSLYPKTLQLVRAKLVDETQQVNYRVSILKVLGLPSSESIGGSFANVFFASLFEEDVRYKDFETVLLLLSRLQESEKEKIYYFLLAASTNKIITYQLKPTGKNDIYGKLFLVLQKMKPLSSSDLLSFTDKQRIITKSDELKEYKHSETVWGEGSILFQLLRVIDNSAMLTRVFNIFSCSLTQPRTHDGVTPLIYALLLNNVNAVRQLLLLLKSDPAVLEMIDGSRHSFLDYIDKCDKGKMSCQLSQGEMKQLLDDQRVRLANTFSESKHSRVNLNVSALKKRLAATQGLRQISAIMPGKHNPGAEKFFKVYLNNMERMRAHTVYRRIGQEVEGPALQEEFKSLFRYLVSELKTYATHSTKHKITGEALLAPKLHEEKLGEQKLAAGVSYKNGDHHVVFAFRSISDKVSQAPRILKGSGPKKMFVIPMDQALSKGHAFSAMADPFILGSGLPSLGTTHYLPPSDDGVVSYYREYTGKMWHLVVVLHDKQQSHRFVIDTDRYIYVDHMIEIGLAYELIVDLLTIYSVAPNSVNALLSGFSAMPKDKQAQYAAGLASQHAIVLRFIDSLSLDKARVEPICTGRTQDLIEIFQLIDGSHIDKVKDKLSQTPGLLHMSADLHGTVLAGREHEACEIDCYYECRNPQVNYAEVDGKHYRYGSTVLIHAALRGNLPLVQWIIEKKGISATQIGYERFRSYAHYYGPTPLLVAVEAEQWEVARYLLQHYHVTSPFTVDYDKYCTGFGGDSNDTHSPPITVKNAYSIAASKQDCPSDILSMLARFGVNAPPGEASSVECSSHSKLASAFLTANVGTTYAFHARAHASRVALFAIAIFNYYRLFDTDSTYGSDKTQEQAILLAGLGHDCGRQGDGEDQPEWEEASGQKTSDYARAQALPDLLNLRVQGAIVKKDSYNESKHLEEIDPILKSLHDADCLDVKRARSVFDHTQLFIFKEFGERFPDLIVKLAKEVEKLERWQGDEYGKQETNVKSFYEGADAFDKTLALIDARNRNGAYVFPILHLLVHGARLIPEVKLSEVRDNLLRHNCLEKVREVPQAISTASQSEQKAVGVVEELSPVSISASRCNFFSNNPQTVVMAGTASSGALIGVTLKLVLGFGLSMLAAMGAGALVGAVLVASILILKWCIEQRSSVTNDQYAQAVPVP